MKTKMEMKRPNVFRLRFKLQILNGIKKSLFLNAIKKNHWISIKPHLGKHILKYVDRYGYILGSV